ncbi:embryo-specific protein ATS3A-like [Phragmites australis]|uniref:embryo-specific protein ATS3A-like n=1 Tax=Phragmites australis TaxID=29695 RepID=UPI002D772D4A|nr:embryo-specific protein ATS3A-like [Phragmites australis]
MEFPGAAVAARRLAPLVLAVLLLLAPPSSVALARDSRTAAAAAAGGSGRRACTYTLKVKTSCASPRRTSDAVSVAFGDAYRNEVQAPRLPSGGNALERCATDTFRVAGPCGYGVCYLNLRRDGRDGWAPEWVQVLEPGPGAAKATFYFGDPLPDGIWYGHDRCPKAAATTEVPRANNSSASPQG